MFILGAHIVSEYSGKTFFGFVQERIFDPLSMSSTTYFSDVADRSGHISQAFTDGRRRIPYWFSSKASAELVAGAGGILSSTVDMVSDIVYGICLHRC